MSDMSTGKISRRNSKKTQSNHLYITGARSMGKANRKRDRKQSPRPAPEPLVNRFAQAHGDYQSAEIIDLTGELSGKRQSIAKVMLNRGGTTVERWKANGSMSQQQQSAIALYANAWRTTFGEQRVVMNWSLTNTIRGLPMETWIAHQIHARDILSDIDQILRNVPAEYIDVWKNVVLFDEAAGKSGSRLGYKNERAEAAAKAIVLFIAGMIGQAMRL